MPLRALIFDLDDTLLVDEAVSEASLKAVAAFIGAIDEKNFVARVRAIAKQKWQAGPCHPFCQAIGISAMECLWGNFFGDDEQLRALRAWALEYRWSVFCEVLQEEKIFLEISLDDLQKKAKECADRFVHERCARQHLFEEAQELIKKLAQHYRLGLLTNGAPDLQRSKIEASGLHDFFSTILISGEHGVGKPEPAIFQKMLEQLGVTAAEAIMVGNSLERDIAGACAAGIRSVWIDLGVDQKKNDLEKNEARPDFTITTLAELMPLVDSLA